MSIGTLSIFDNDAHILIDTGAQRSFISEKFAQYSNCELCPLPEELVVRTPLGEDIIRTMVYRDYDERIGDTKLEANLIPLELYDFDAILGMDWLERHHMIVNYFMKKVIFCKPEATIVAFQRE